MEKTEFITQQITKNTRISKKSITAMAIRNYGTTAMNVIHNNIVFVIPPFDADNSYARSFDMIPCDNTYSDIEFDIEFETGLGKCVLLFKELTSITNPQNC